MGSRAVVGFVGGLLAWSLAEYATHRWAMHAPGAGSVAGPERNPLAAEHLDHHRVPASTVPLRLDRHNVAYKGAALVLGSLLVSPAFGSGFTTGYASYTRLHDRIHHTRPRGRVARILWRNHLRHHSLSQRGLGAGFGVTSPLWDVVLATREPSQRAASEGQRGRGSVGEDSVGE
jgi:sterol desaturase/sphingolipid hydroxylase (fatty acid hydroxylase superfamily)